MTKRIDFIRSNESKYGWEVKFNKGDFIIAYQTEDGIMLKHRSWEITINFRLAKINFISTSKAKIKTRDKFEMNMRPGSLFLYNSSYDWYWYFRNATLQNRLDTLCIDKIVHVNNYSEIKETYYHKYENEKCIIDNEKSLMVYPHNPQYVYIPKAIIQPYESKDGIEKLSPDKYMVHDITFVVDSQNPFLVVYHKDVDICTLYILSKYKLSDIPELESINESIINHCTYLEFEKED